MRPIERGAAPFTPWADCEVIETWHVWNMPLAGITRCGDGTLVGFLNITGGGVERFSWWVLGEVDEVGVDQVRKALDVDVDNALSEVLYDHIIRDPDAVVVVDDYDSGVVTSLRRAALGMAS